MKRIILIFILSGIAVFSKAQWKQSDSTFKGRVKSLAAGSENVYAVIEDMYSDTLAGKIHYKDGIIKSTDYGENWSAVNIDNRNFCKIFQLAASSEKVIAATDASILISTDNGITWKEKFKGLPINPNDTLALPYTHSIVFEGDKIFMGGRGRVYMSSNDGRSWKEIKNGFDEDAKILSFTDKEKYFYAGTTKGLYVSADDGKNWSAISGGLTNFRVASVAAYKKTVFVKTALPDGIYLSLDSCESWKQLDGELKCSPICIELLRRLMFVGCGDGVRLSVDKGKNWSDISEGLPPGTSVYSLCLSGGRIIAGTEKGIWRRELQDFLSASKFGISNYPVISSSNASSHTLLNLYNSIIKDEHLKRNDTAFSKTYLYGEILKILEINKDDYSGLKNFDTLASGIFGKYMLEDIMDGMTGKEEKFAKDSIEKLTADAFLKYSKIRNDFNDEYKRLKQKTVIDNGAVQKLTNAVDAFRHALIESKIGYAFEGNYARGLVRDSIDCDISARLFNQLCGEAGFDMKFVALNFHALSAYAENGKVLYHIETAQLCYNSDLEKAIQLANQENDTAKLRLIDEYTRPIYPPATWQRLYVMGPYDYIDDETENLILDWSLQKDVARIQKKKD